MDLGNLQVTDVKKSTFDYIKEHLGLYVVFPIVLLVITIFILFTFSTVVDPRFIMIPIMIGIALYSSVYNKVKAQFMKQFGASIGFSYSPSAPMTSVSGKLFQIGSSQKISNILTGTYENVPMRIFSYQYTVGGGKNSHTYTFTVFEVGLPKAVPEIILNSASAGFYAPEFGFSEKHTHIKLEGDFNKYFSLSVPAGSEQEAYQIFSPDVMAKLIDNAKDLNFEFSGNQLYIYNSKDLNTTESMQKMFNLVDFLMDILRHNVAGI